MKSEHLLRSLESDIEFAKMRLKLLQRANSISDEEMEDCFDCLEDFDCLMVQLRVNLERQG